MPKLIILNDQAGATGKKIKKYPPKTTATGMIMDCFPDAPPCPESTIIAINGNPVDLNKHPNMALLTELKGLDVVTVTNTVHGIEFATLSLYAAWASAGLGVAGAIYAYTQTPDIPGNAGNRKDSPNNSHSGQVNVIREGQSYPFIFGQPRCFPDLTGEAVSEYVDNIKVVTQFMALGYGLFDLSAPVKAGETDLTNFPDSSATFHEPVNGITTVPTLTTSFASNEIDGQELLAANDGEVLEVYPMTLSTALPSDVTAGAMTLHVVQDVATDQLKADFDASTKLFQINVDYVDVTIPPPPGTPIETSESGSGVVDSITLVIDAINGNYYTILLPTFTGPDTTDAMADPIEARLRSGSNIGAIGFATQAEEIWIDIVFRRGLKGEVDLTLQVQELDAPGGSPIGAEIVSQFSYYASTFDAQYRTYKLVVPLGYYEFTLTRTDETDNDANKPDETKIEAANAIRHFTNREFGNMTCLTVVVPATREATSLRENKINIRPVSKLITYENGAVNYTPQPSRKMADCLLHLWVDHFGNPPELLALDELYAIQNKLDVIDPRLATFDFTFDDLDVSLEDRMRAILQVARCTFWNDGGVYRFVRDEARDFPSTTITRMDITHEEDREYSISYNPQLLERYDSVKVQYIDPTTNKKAYIYRKVDNAGNIVDGAGNNPSPIDLAGCQESYNAINRAELEARKLLYQRWTLTDTCHKSAMALDTGDMVLYSEQYNNSETFDGEITAVNGNIATVSEHLDFVGGLSYVVYYTIDDGSLVGPFPITEVAGNEFQFECASLSQVYLRDGQLGFEVQAGSRFIIGTVTDLAASQWSVIKKEPAGDKVQLTMLNYSDNVYEFDTQ